jgi:hypothetical protein
MRSNFTTPTEIFLLTASAVLASPMFPEIPQSSTATTSSFTRSFATLMPHHNSLHWQHRAILQQQK